VAQVHCAVLKVSLELHFNVGQQLVDILEQEAERTHSNTIIELFFHVQHLISS
jgi:hypothetical protein